MLVALIFIAGRRDDESFTLERALDLELGDLEIGGADELPPPQAAAEAAS